MEELSHDAPRLCYFQCNVLYRCDQKPKRQRVDTYPSLTFRVVKKSQPIRVVISLNTTWRVVRL